MRRIRNGWRHLLPAFWYKFTKVRRPLGQKYSMAGKPYKLWKSLYFWRVRSLLLLSARVVRSLLLLLLSARVLIFNNYAEQFSLYDILASDRLYRCTATGTGKVQYGFHHKSQIRMTCRQKKMTILHDWPKFADPKISADGAPWAEICLTSGFGTWGHRRMSHSWSHTHDQ